MVDPGVEGDGVVDPGVEGEGVVDPGVESEGVVDPGVEGEGVVAVVIGPVAMQKKKNRICTKQI